MLNMEILLLENVVPLPCNCCYSVNKLTKLGRCDR